MHWIIVLGVLIYIAIGRIFVTELDDYDGGDGGLGSYIVFLIWPFIALLWVMVLILIVIPDRIVKWFKHRRNR